MRKRLNEDPRVQMAVFAVIGVIVAFYLFTTVMKKDPATDTAATPATPAATTPATGSPADGSGTAPVDSSTGSGAPGSSGSPDSSGTPASGATETPADPGATATPTDPSAAGTGSIPSTPVTPAPGGSTDTASGLLPGKGLPEDVLVAYAKNQAIALLVVDPKGLSDKQLKTFTEPLKKRKDVTLFVVDSKDIGDYYRITAGVQVDRVPALVVIRPRKLTDDAPTATVSYGFRGPRSVDQAVDDALYDGKAVPSYP